MVRIPQNNIIKAGLNGSLDMDDLVILSFVHHFLTGDGDKYRKTIEVEGEEFYRVHYPTILEKWPTLGLKSRGALTARFKRYFELGLLEKYLAPEHTLYVRPTDLLNSIYARDPLSSDEDSVFTPVNGPVHDGEEPIHNGEQTVHGDEHGVHGGEEHNKEVKEVKESLKEIGADKVRAKETPEKDPLTEADASARSLSKTKNKKDSAREKNRIGESEIPPSQEVSPVPNSTLDGENKQNLNGEMDLKLWPEVLNYLYTLTDRERDQFDRRVLRLWGGEGKPGPVEKRKLAICQYITERTAQISGNNTT